MKKVKTTFLTALILFITTLTMNVKAYTNTNNTSTTDTNTTYYDNNAKVQLICVDPYMQGLAQGESVTCVGLNSLTSAEQVTLKKIGCIIFNTDSTYTGKTDNQAIATAVHNKIAAAGSGYYYHWNPSQSLMDAQPLIKSVVKIIGDDTSLTQTCTTCGNVTVSATTPTMSGTDFKSTITVTMPSGISATLSTTKGTLSQSTISTSGGTATLTYPVSSVTSNTTATITAKINCASPDTSKYEICDYNGATRQRFFVYGRKTEERSNTATVTFTPAAGGIKIIKKDSKSNNALDGAKFRVYTTDSNGNCTTTEAKHIDGTSIGEVTTTSGTVTISNLMQGKYCVKETSSPGANYIVSADPKKVDVTAAQTTDVTFTNEPLGEIVIQKKDGDIPLQGAEFELYKCSGAGTGCTTIVKKDAKDNTITIAKEINGVTKYVLISNNTTSTAVGANTPTGTDVNGQIVIKNLEYGYYAIKEVAAPVVGNQGYALIGNTAIVHLTSGSTCPQYRPNAVPSEGVACVETLINNSQIKIKLVKLGLDKAGKKPTTPIKLKGAVFKITADLGSGIWDDVSVVKEDGAIVGIKPGEYTIKEVVSPSGYASMFTEVRVKINDNGTITILTPNDMVEKKSGTIPELDFYNRPSNLIISKQDIANGEELPGATLHVVCEDGLDEEWVSTKEPKEFFVEPNVTCILRETVAPDGYEIELNELEFKIDDRGNVVSVKDLKADANYKLEANEITIYNGLKVPDTGKAVSIVAAILGIGLISGGIYILVRKLKEEPKIA